MWDGWGLLVGTCMDNPYKNVFKYKRFITTCVVNSIGLL